MNGRFVSVIVPAAGQASRMGGEKQRLMLKDAPVLVQTLRAFQNADCVNEIVVAARQADAEEFLSYRIRYGIDKLRTVVPGGETRQQSVQCALSAVSECATVLAIHDGARPLIEPEDIERIVDAAERYGGATAASRVKDTVKTSKDGQTVDATLPRNTLWAVQTPQAFQKDLYMSAMQKAVADGKDFTDDCQLFEYAGRGVFLVDTGYKNIKITTPEDMVIAEAFIKKEESGLRIGHGYDVHRLVEGRSLILGGVEIPYKKGLLGHSDADVLLHAIADALLGAAALGDIGKWFPDSDERYRGADSRMLLRQVIDLLTEHGFSVQNIDATVLAQAPKLAPHIEKMRQNIAEDCQIAVDRVSVKATTEEKLGFTGAGEGIAAHAVCLIKK